MAILKNVGLKTSTIDEIKANFDGPNFNPNFYRNLNSKILYT